MRIQEGAYRERPRDAANRHQVVTTHAQAYYRVSDVGGVQLHSRDACGSSHLPRVRWVLGRINLVVATSPPCQFGANPARTLFASLSPCELAMLCRPIQGAAWRRDVQHFSTPRMIPAYSVHHTVVALHSYSRALSGSTSYPSNTGTTDTCILPVGRTGSFCSAAFSWGSRSAAPRRGPWCWLRLRSWDSGDAPSFSDRSMPERIPRDDRPTGCGTLW